LGKLGPAQLERGFLDGNASYPGRALELKVIVDAILFSKRERFKRIEPIFFNGDDGDGLEPWSDVQDEVVVVMEFPQVFVCFKRLSGVVDEVILFSAVACELIDKAAKERPLPGVFRPTFIVEEGGESSVEVAGGVALKVPGDEVEQVFFLILLQLSSCDDSARKSGPEWKLEELLSDFGKALVLVNGAQPEGEFTGFLPGLGWWWSEPAEACWKLPCEEICVRKVGLEDLRYGELLTRQKILFSIQSKADAVRSSSRGPPVESPKTEW
jgi:hypothetical protein